MIILYLLARYFYKGKPPTSFIILRYSRFLEWKMAGCGGAYLSSQPALWKQRQADLCESTVSLVNKVSFRLHSEILSQKNKIKIKNKQKRKINSSSFHNN